MSTPIIQEAYASPSSEAPSVKQWVDCATQTEESALASTSDLASVAEPGSPARMTHLEWLRYCNWALRTNTTVPFVNDHLASCLLLGSSTSSSSSSGVVMHRPTDHDHKKKLSRVQW